RQQATHQPNRIAIVSLREQRGIALWLAGERLQSFRFRGQFGSIEFAEIAVRPIRLDERVSTDEETALPREMLRHPGVGAIQYPRESEPATIDARKFVAARIQRPPDFGEVRFEFAELATEPIGAEQPVIGSVPVADP